MACILRMQESLPWQRGPTCAAAVGERRQLDLLAGLQHHRLVAAIQGGEVRQADREGGGNGGKRVARLGHIVVAAAAGAGILAAARVPAGRERSSMLRSGHAAGSAQLWLALRRRKAPPPGCPADQHVRPGNSMPAPATRSQHPPAGQLDKAVGSQGGGVEVGVGILEVQGRQAQAGGNGGQGVAGLDLVVLARVAVGGCTRRARHKGHQLLPPTARVTARE